MQPTRLTNLYAGKIQTAINGDCFAETKLVTTMYLINAQWDVSHKKKYYIISVRFVKSGCMFLSLEAGNWKLDVHVQQY